MVWRILSTNQIDKTESSFVGLIGFECPLMGNIGYVAKFGESRVNFW